MYIPFLAGEMVPNPRRNPYLNFAGAMHEGALNKTVIGAKEAPSMFVHPGNLSMSWFAFRDMSTPSLGTLLFGAKDPDGWAKELFIIPQHWKTPLAVQGWNQSHQSNPYEPSQITVDPVFDPADPAFGTPSEYLDLGIQMKPRFNHTFDNDVPSIEFTTFLSLINGDAFSAAEYYGDWAQSQAFFPALPMNQDGAYSSLISSATAMGWIAANTCAITESSSCGNPAPPGAAQLMTNDDSTWSNWAAELSFWDIIFPGVKTANTMYRWDKNSFNSRNWGEWFEIDPAKDPVPPHKVPKSSFEVAASSANSLPGHSWSFYFNPVQISDAAPDYASLPTSYPVPFAGNSISNYVVQDETGQPSPSAPHEWFRSDVACGTGANEQCSNRNRLAPETGFPYQYSLEAAKEMAAIGTNGIYLDVFNWSPAPCYNTTHGGHDELLNGVQTTVTGGGLYAMNAQVDLVRQLELDMLTLGYSDWYQQVEMPVEYYFPYVEYSFCNQSYIKQSTLLADYGSYGPHSFSFPLFSAVYGDRHRLTRTAGISGNQELEQDPAVGLGFRQYYSADLSIGIAPTLGAVLTSNTLAQKYGRPSFEPLTKAVDMLANYFDVLKRPPVHRLIVYGLEGRPIQTSSPVLAIPYPLPQGQAPPFPVNMSFGPDQPYVYSSTWYERVASSQPITELGIFLTNWTDAGDALDPTLGTFFSTSVPGTQTITLTIDPSEYGLLPKIYRVAQYVSGATQAASLLDLTGGPGSMTVTVPARSAVFLRLH